MITTVLSLSALLLREDSAKQTFLTVMESYGKLDSVSVDIEHDNSSGLFPGKYHQQLFFKKGKGFKLVVTGLKDGVRPDNIAPDYYCDGTDVTSVGRSAGVRPINKDSNISPGYEVSGGLMMTWLLDSPTKNFFSTPPAGVELTMAWGKRTTWKDEKVSEVIMTFKAGERSSVLSLFLDADKKKLLGNEWTREGKTGTMVYKNQKENPEVDPKMFVPPSK